ncbi:Structural maintenance of chromosomes protein 2-1 [Vitis vinifera]|uniref:Structural maintenance of chromosomes protein 2-1 n=1 Tax=Vitis vinifera TaxID=29760 RepID=A0A438C7Q9_VITVI|nr:Structural maintenance of chromosomes protein 2-1 [Vitis vinifera]
MYIKDICLEGFKSYATRTVVPGFDPYFNAITGLNGSCKSNILDSICFVLGITNLRQVLASNLQKLVYKQGQAGITKATVSVVFDNSDRSRSPLGYQDCPELRKYGRCVGTSCLLAETRGKYPVYVVFVSATEKYPKFCIAYEFVQAEKIRDSAVSGVEQVKTKTADIEESHKRMQVEIQEMETQVSNLTAEKKASLGGEVKVLSENIDALSRELVKQASVLKNQEDTLRSEKENAEKRASVVKRAEDGAVDLKQRVEGLSKNLEECEKEYQGVLAGKSSGSEEKCLEDQLADAKVAVGRAETELKQLNTKITHREKELKEKTNESISKREEAVSVENELNVRRKDVENIKMALESLTYKGQMEALQKVGKENTELALSLVGYDEELKCLDIISSIVLKGSRRTKTQSASKAWV